MQVTYGLVRLGVRRIELYRSCQGLALQIRFAQTAIAQPQRVVELRISGAVFHRLDERVHRLFVVALAVGRQAPTPVSVCQV